MKRVILIFREGFDSRYILSCLKSFHTGNNIQIILESGTIARKKKLTRLIKKYKWTKLFSFIIDMGALFFYDKIMCYKMKKLLGKQCNENFDFFHIEDVNEDRCIQYINEFEPDLILIYGTGIVSEKTLQQIQCDFFNIHSSVLPYYRNVHSDFWAYLNDEYDKIGITIFKLNEGIDTGKIAKQKVCDIPFHSKLEEYKVRNLKIIVELIPVFIETYFMGKLDFLEQDEKAAFATQTPTANDILKLFKKIRGK
ncbi:MAG: formyltransferase family protein [Lachnospiraceae bacterium]